MKRLFKFLVIVLVLVLVLVALAPTLFSGFIKDAVIDVAGSKMDGRLEIRDFSFGWTSGVEMEGLQFFRRGETQPALEVGSASAQPAIMAALSGSYEVSDINLKDVTLRVIAPQPEAPKKTPKKSDEPTAKKEPKEKAPESKPEPISVPDFRAFGKIENLRVIYQGADGQAPLEVIGLNLDFSSARNEDASLKLTGPQDLSAEMTASIFHDGKLLDQSEMRAEGKLRVPRAQLADLAQGLAALIKVDAGRIMLEQDFVYAGGALDIKGRMELDNLAATQEAVALKLGMATMKNDLVMGKSGLSGQLELRMSATSVAGLERQVAPFLVDDLAAQLNLPSTDVVRVESGYAKTPYGRVDVSGELRQDAASGIAMKGGLDLGALAALFDGLPKLAGQLTLNGTVMREAELLRFRGNHRAEGLSAESMTPGGPALVNETLTLGHDISLANGLLDLTMLDLDSSFAKLKEEGLRIHLDDDYRIENYGKKADPLVGSLDLDRLSTLAGEMLPVQLKGRVDLAAHIRSEGGIESASVDMIVDSLVMSGGVFGEKTLNSGRTKLGLDLKDLSKGAMSPMALVASSRLFDLQAGTTLASDPEALYGRTGTVAVSGTADLQELLSPFMAADHYGKSDLVLDLELLKDGLRLGRLRVNDKAMAIDGSGQLQEVGGQQVMAFQFKPGHYVNAEGARLQFGALELKAERGLDNNQADFQLVAKDLATKSAAAGSTLVQAGDFSAKTEGEFDAVNSTLNMKISEFRGGGMDLSGLVNWSSAGGLEALKLAGQVDWNELSSRFLTLFDPNASGQGKTPITIDLTSSGGTMATSSGRVDLKIPALKIKGFDLANLDLAASMTNGKGKVERGQADLNSGKVTLGGDIDMTLDEPQFGSQFKADKVQLVKEWQPALARVIPLFAGLGVNFSGVMDADLDLRGQGATWDVISRALNGEGDVSLRSARVEGSPILDAIGLAVGFSPDMNINDLSTAFLIKNGGVHQDNLVINTGVLDLKMSGTTYLDGRLDYDIGLKPIGNQPARWQQFLSLVASDGYLPLGLAGTIDSPSPKLPSPEEMIKKGAEGLIKKGLGDLLNKNSGADGQEAGEEKKPNNPVGGLIDLFGGKKKKDDDKKN